MVILGYRVSDLDYVVADVNLSDPMALGSFGFSMFLNQKTRTIQNFNGLI